MPNRQQLVSKSQDEDCTPNRQQLVNEFKNVSDEAIFRIPWGHHIVILGKRAEYRAQIVSTLSTQLQQQSAAIIVNRLLHTQHENLRF